MWTFSHGGILSCSKCVCHSLILTLGYFLLVRSLCLCPRPFLCSLSCYIIKKQKSLNTHTVYLYINAPHSFSHFPLPLFFFCVCSWVLGLWGSLILGSWTLGFSVFLGSPCSWVLGRGVPAVPGAFQGALHTAMTQSQLDVAVRTTMRCGGCTASRASFIGACLGAKVGLQGIPESWKNRTLRYPLLLELAKDVVSSQLA